MYGMELYDIKGNRISTILNERRLPGPHEVRVDLSGLSAGVYLYSIEAGPLRDTKQIVIQ